MVDTRKPLDTLTRAIEVALDSGVTKSEIHNLVATANAPSTNNGHIADDVSKADGYLPIYDVLPPGLIDLPTAAKDLGYSVKRLWRWVHRGRIKVRGRLKAPARGGGYLVVDEGELFAYKKIAGSNKGGRPRKIRDSDT